MNTHTSTPWHTWMPHWSRKVLQLICGSVMFVSSQSFLMFKHQRIWRPTKSSKYVSLNCLSTQCMGDRLKKNLIVICKKRKFLPSYNKQNKMHDKNKLCINLNLREKLLMGIMIPGNTYIYWQHKQWNTNYVKLSLVFPHLMGRASGQRHCNVIKVWGITEVALPNLLYRLCSLVHKTNEHAIQCNVK